jgi:hypothetical protein
MHRSLQRIKEKPVATAAIVAIFAGTFFVIPTMPWLVALTATVVALAVSSA